MALWNQTMTPDQSNDKPSVAPVAIPQVTPSPAATPTPPPPVLTTRESILKESALKESVLRARRESVFGSGVTIEGKIEGDADVRIGGKFKGDIQIKGDLSVEKGAYLTAKINASNVTVSGEVNGNIVSSGQVKLLETGQLTGDLKASTLTVAAGSRMRGHVEFGWSGAEVAKFVNGSARENEKKRTDG
ncbi:MAG TPA: polymer-forming cytoskeletal protein [Candidatus Binatia bacterium]|jgi:cytoskeletal protein CcmA (bactofilin family)